VKRIVAALAPALSLLALAGCSGANLDAGSDRPRGPLPVDERNPIIVNNDGARDNWQGEFAVALASAGQIKLAGIVVDASSDYPSLSDNLAAWDELVMSARASGMRDIPDPIASDSAVLAAPPDGQIDSTTPNDSAGARFILDASARLSQPLRPVVVATGGRLTDLADAYLLDPTVVERVTVVASAGETNGESISTGWPNGDLDPWATAIVVSKFRYVQVNTYYEQRDDVPASRAADLPANAFGAWMNSKLGEILELHEAADQGSVIASALPAFPLDVLHASTTDAQGVTGSPPTLTADSSSDAGGHVWAVTRGDHAAATAQFWQLLGDPKTFGQ
jgi:hypothetical protein